MASNASVSTEATFTSPALRPVCENLLVGEPSQTRRFGPSWPEVSTSLCSLCVTVPNAPVPSFCTAPSSPADSQCWPWWSWPPAYPPCHSVTLAKLFLFQKICKYCLNAFVNFFLQKTLQIDNWLFENYCSQVSIKIRKSPNHKGLSFICAFTFSVFGYRISPAKYRVLVWFCQVLVLNVYSSFSFPAILPTYSQPFHTKTADHLHYQPKSFL